MGRNLQNTACGASGGHMECETKPWRAVRKYPKRSDHHQNSNNHRRGGRAAGNSFRDGRNSPYPVNFRRRPPLIESQKQTDFNTEPCEDTNNGPIKRGRGPSRPPIKTRQLEEAEKAWNACITGSLRVEQHNNQSLPRSDENAEAESVEQRDNQSLPRLDENPLRESLYHCMRRCLIELNSRHNENMKNVDRLEEENEDIRRRLMSMETEVCKLKNRLQVLELNGNYSRAASSEGSFA